MRRDPQISRVRDRRQRKFVGDRACGGSPNNATIRWLREEEALGTLPGISQGQLARVLSRWVRTRLGKSRVSLGDAGPDPGRHLVILGRLTFSRHELPAWLVSTLCRAPGWAVGAKNRDVTQPQHRVAVRVVPRAIAKNGKNTWGAYFPQPVANF